MNIRIEPSALSGSVTAPPSKSCAHRLLIASALSGGSCTVSNIPHGEDVAATLDCLSALGADFTITGNSVYFTGTQRESGRVFPCRESGSTLRFLLPVVAALTDCAEFRGSPRLIERGIDEYERVLPSHDVKITETADGFLTSGRLRAGDYTVRGDLSSQFASGLLMALPLVEGDSLLRLLPPVESRPYIALTRDVFRRFGIIIEEREENLFFLRGGQSCQSRDTTVEGDWSNAAVLFALKTLGAGIEIAGLAEDSGQGDRICLAYFEELAASPAELDVSDCPDLAPLLLCIAALKHGGRLTGTRRLCLKESDRAQTMAQELAKFGADIYVYDNSVDIKYKPLHTPTAILNCHNDHRIAMALTLLCSRFGGTLEGADCVGKSWREFFDVMKEIGLKVYT